MRFVDLSGTVFGHWTVLACGIKDTRGRHKWICLCSCGVKKMVDGTNLRTGKTKSCGCHSADKTRTHGKTRSKLYQTWRAMIQRCENKNHKMYHRYGARNIGVCDRWRSSFIDFAADMGELPDGATLDRKDNNAGYSPENCQWASRLDQSLNRENTVFLEFNGVTKRIGEWSKHSGIPVSVIRKRLSKSGWTIGQALTIPIGATNRWRRPHQC